MIEFVFWKYTLSLIFDNSQSQKDILRNIILSLLEKKFIFEAKVLKVI